MSAFIQRVVPSLLLLTALRNWKLFRMLFASSDVTLLSVTMLLYLLLALSVAGLWKGARWGFYAFYLLVPLATILHGIALIPIITVALPPSLQPGATLLVNAGLLISVGASHRRLAARSRSVATLPGAV